ncbi:MAG: archease [archaeon]
MKFEYLEDVATADIAFKAQGNSLNELFENCALAVAETIADTNTIKPNITKSLVLEAPDQEQLLFLFLSELTYFKDAELLFFSKFDVEVKGNKLKAKIHGEKINKNIKIRNDVKAITMYMLKIEKKKDKFFATVVVDI